MELDAIKDEIDFKVIHVLEAAPGESPMENLALKILEGVPGIHLDFKCFFFSIEQHHSDAQRGYVPKLVPPLAGTAGVAN